MTLAQGPLLSGPLLTGATATVSTPETDAIVLRKNGGEGILSTANDITRTRMIPHVQNQAGMGLFRTKTMAAKHTAVWTLSWRSPRPVISNALEQHYLDNVGAVFPLLMQFDDDPDDAPFVQYLSTPNITRINGRRVSYSIELGEVPRSMVQIPT